MDETICSRQLWCVQIIVARPGKREPVKGWWWSHRGIDREIKIHSPLQGLGICYDKGLLNREWYNQAFSKDHSGLYTDSRPQEDKSVTHFDIPNHQNSILYKVNLVTIKNLTVSQTSPTLRWHF